MTISATLSGLGQFRQRFTTKLSGDHLELKGTATARLLSSHGGVWLYVEITGRESEWKIEHIGWNY